MRILLNGQPVEELSAKDLKALSISAERDVVEGTVLSVDEAVAATGRNLRLVYGIVCGLGAAIYGAGLVAAAVYEPRDLVGLVPLGLILAVALAALLRFFYRRNLVMTRGVLTPRLARMAPPGVPIRVDGAGVSMAGSQAAWSDIVIASVEFRTIPVSEGPDMTIIESITLSCPDQAMVLDHGGLVNGRAIVDKAWLRLHNGGSSHV
jgi:hypothetical protein